MGKFRLSLVGVLAVSLSLKAGAVERLVYMHETGEGPTASKQIVIGQSDGEFSASLTSGPNYFLYPDVSADGLEAVFVEMTPDGKKSSIVWMNLSSRQKQVIAEGEGMFLHPRLSRDGRFVAFSAPANGKAGQLLRAELASVRKGEKPVLESSNLEGQAYFPALSPNGEFSVFQWNQSGKKQLAYYDWVGRTATILPQAGEYAMSPALDEAGRKVVFTAKESGKWSIRTLDLSTRAVQVVLQSGFEDFAPSFCGNDSVVFASNREGTFQIFRGALKFGQLKDLRKLTWDSGSHYAPKCSGKTAYSQGLYSSMPAPARSSFGAARLGDSIYVVGGHQGHEHTYPPESFLDRVDVFNLKTQSWKTVRSRPVAAHGFQVVAYGQYLYAFGGFAYEAANSPKWKSLDLIDRYDPASDQWVTVGRMPRARSSNVVAVVGSKAYLIGGWDSTPLKAGDLEGRFHREIDLFDFETGKSSETAFQLPNPLRRAMTGVAVGGKILIIGGISVGASHFNLLDQVTEFDPTTGIWREREKLPFATFAPAAGAVGEDVFVFGGMWKTGEMEYNYIDSIYRLSAKTAKWAATAQFTHEPKGFSSVVNLDGGALGVLGGHWYHDDTDSPVDTFEIFRSQ